MMAAPLSLVPSWPMKLSVPAALQIRPGTVPCITGCAGAVEQAARSAGVSINNLRIDGLLNGLGNPAHLELAVLNCEGKPAFDQVERVLPKLFVAPSRED